MARYLDPKVDFLFKKIFGENRELIISFLNSLLPLEEGREIVEIEYLSPEQTPATALGKLSIVDVRCKDNTGRAFVVEMQSEWTNVFRKRLLLNGSKAIVRQMDREFEEEKARKFIKLQPVYVLAIVNGRFSKGKDWYHHLQIVDVKNPDVIIDGLDYVLVELPNFTREKWANVYPFASRELRGKYRELAVLWLRFLKEIEGYNEELPKEFVSNELIYRAIKICERAAFTQKEMLAYEDAVEQMMIENTYKILEDRDVENRKTIADHVNTIAQKDNTIAQKDNTIAELHQAQKTAIKEMLADGMPIEKIAKYTGLAIEEITKLANSL